MSWHYLAEQEGESSVACCAGGEPWQPSKLKITHGLFCCNGKLTESYLDSLSGTMCERSTEQSGVEELTSSREDFHAPTFHSLERALELLENIPDCGLNSNGSFAKYDHDSHSWKTRQLSLFGGCAQFSETWPKWGMMHDGECWVVETPEGCTNGTESGLWRLPTVVKSEYKGSSRKRYRGSPHFRGAKMSEGVRTSKEDSIYLSPSFCELNMMWPIMWTGLAPLEMDRFQSWLKWHGRHFPPDCDTLKIPLDTKAH